MKTTIVKGGSQPQKEIDWSKPQVVISKTGTILITDGDHIDEHFWGTVLFGYAIKAGKSTDNWLKTDFTPLTEPITITFEND